MFLGVLNFICLDLSQKVSALGSIEKPQNSTKIQTPALNMCMTGQDRGNFDIPEFVYV